MNSNNVREAKYLDVQTAAVVTSSESDNDHRRHYDLPSAKAVSSPSSSSSSSSFGGHVTRPESMDMEGALVKGTIQEPAYRDKWFGIAFLAHFGIMIAVATLYATGTLETVAPDPTRRLLVAINFRRMMLQEDEYSSTYAPDDTESINYSYQEEEQSSSNSLVNDSSSSASEEDEDLSAAAIVFTFLLSFCTAPVLAMLAMKHMMTHAIQLIQVSLYLAIGLNGVLGVVFLVLGGPMAGVWNLIFAAILVCYTKAVWHRIPFAAANLKAAVTCVHSNLGMLLLALTSIPVFAVWLVLWTFVFGCVMNSPWMKSQESEVQATDDVVNGTSTTHEEETLTTEGVLAVVALLLSFYWTWHVVRNVVHTTLAGTVGTWWFLPQEANGCCSRGLRDSLGRSLTYSFGSICLGSLIVAIIEVIKSMLRSSARNRRAGILRLVAQCLLIWVERIAEYFNKWAFVYVGLYGYSYVEAGKNVFALFRHRGWSTIISDSLVNRMLAMMCLSIGLINAIAAAIFSLLGSSSMDALWVNAFLAFFLGLLMSSLAFGVLISAVDSIIVLWAEAPAEFKDNHPVLCQELEDTWTQAWPDIFSPGGGATTAVATQVV